MNDNNLLFAQSFVNNFPEGSPPCSLFITGGGFSLLDIGKVPGASRVLADAYVAYHMLEEIDFLRTVLGDRVDDFINGEVKFVSPWPTYWYAKAMLLRHELTIPDATICVVNAALTTNRWRKGENETFFALINRPGDKDALVRMFRLDLSKLSESEYQDITNRHEQNKESNPSSVFIDPILRRRMIEDTKVTQVAMALILNDLSMIKCLDKDESLYPLDIVDIDLGPENFVSVGNRLK